MVFQLENVVPWGRSLNDYQGMFNLTTTELGLNLLDCGGGPASFNAEMTAQGYRVTSCDPVYQFTAAQINNRIQATYQPIVDGVAAHPERFVWQHYQSPTQMAESRLAAMQQFLLDFPQGLQAGRYVVAELPHLPFAEAQFELALCSHLLFTYGNILSLEFHQQAVAELCRVARQVRIFPLVEQFSGQPSPHLPLVLQHLHQWGYETEIIAVAYEFQRGGNQMLQIRTV
uniref:SAM-dependent methyltransferase n=1 Tax=Cyanothece sp. (strain PCC 7425 / ATCC 29141) TaxID=395961 RepID=B8HPT1_CYAP4